MSLQAIAESITPLGRLAASVGLLVGVYVLLVRTRSRNVWRGYETARRNPRPRGTKAEVFCSPPEREPPPTPSASPLRRFQAPVTEPVVASSVDSKVGAE